jgi:hypothetical protein
MVPRAATPAAATYWAGLRLTAHTAALRTPTRAPIPHRRQDRSRADSR